MGKILPNSIICYKEIICERKSPSMQQASLISYFKLSQPLAITILGVRLKHLFILSFTTCSLTGSGTVWDAWGILVSKSIKIPALIKLTFEYVSGECRETDNKQPAQLVNVILVVYKSDALLGRSKQSKMSRSISGGQELIAVLNRLVLGVTHWYLICAKTRKQIGEPCRN